MSLHLFILSYWCGSILKISFDKITKLNSFDPNTILKILYCPYFKIHHFLVITIVILLQFMWFQNYGIKFGGSMIESSQTSKFPPHRTNVKKKKSKQTSQENTLKLKEKVPSLMFYSHWNHFSLKENILKFLQVSLSMQISDLLSSSYT